MLAIVFELVNPQFGIGTSGRWFLVDQDLKPLTVTDDVINFSLDFIFHQVYLVGVCPFQPGQVSLPHFVAKLIRLVV